MSAAAAERLASLTRGSAAAEQASSLTEDATALGSLAPAPLVPQPGGFADGGAPAQQPFGEADLPGLTMCTRPSGAARVLGGSTTGQANPSAGCGTVDDEQQLSLIALHCDAAQPPAWQCQESCAHRLLLAML